MMMHSSNPAFRRRSGVQGQLGYKRHCVTKPEITKNKINKAYIDIAISLILVRTQYKNRTNTL